MKLIIAAFLGLLIGVAAVPEDPIDAHRYADTVAYLRMAAALNDFHRSHNVPAKPNHELTLPANGGDKERYRAAKSAIHEWESAMERAGY